MIAESARANPLFHPLMSSVPADARPSPVPSGSRPTNAFYATPACAAEYLGPLCKGQLGGLGPISGSKVFCAAHGIPHCRQSAVDAEKEKLAKEIGRAMSTSNTASMISAATLQPYGDARAIRRNRPPAAMLWGHFVSGPAPAGSSSVVGDRRDQMPIERVPAWFLVEGARIYGSLAGTQLEYRRRPWPVQCP